MPALAPNALVAAIIDGLSESGYASRLTSSVQKHPRQFVVFVNDGSFSISVYAWTLTFGGRPSLPNEYRIQMTSVPSPLQAGQDLTVLLGYEPTLRLFAGFDFVKHQTFTTGSPSVQIDIEELKRAEIEGLSFHRKTNDEIAVGIRPDMLFAYCQNAKLLHRFGRDAAVLRLLNDAVRPDKPPTAPIAPLSTERKRIISEVSKLSRFAGFRRQVLYAYGNRCAVSRVQLRLVDAAHILPAGAPYSSDHVRNGIALSPTYHRAFDAGLIYLDEHYQMRVNDGLLATLRRLDLAGGSEMFRRPLGQVFLPPDPDQRPSVDLIKRANKFRQIA